MKLIVFFGKLSFLNLLYLGRSYAILYYVLRKASVCIIIYCDLSDVAFVYNRSMYAPKRKAAKDTEYEFGNQLLNIC